MGKYTVRLWDMATGTLRYVMAGHTGGINSVAFSPDGYTLASGGTDGIVLLWDVAAAGTGTPLAAGDFHNLVTNPDGRWEVWRIGTTVTATFSSPRAPVQYYARQNPQPQFVLPTGFRPTALVTHTETGRRVHADRTPVPNAQLATFDLTIGPNGEMRYVDNPKVDDLGYVDYRVTRLMWQTAEASEPPCSPGTGVSAEDDTAPGR